MSAIRIAILPGDGIGNEITEPAMAIARRAVERTGLPALEEDWLPAGAATYRDTGEALPTATVEGCRRADAILLAAMGDPAIRYPDGTEIIPQIELRFILDLYAGVRPVSSIRGVAGPLGDPRGQALDFVLIR